MAQIYRCDDRHYDKMFEIHQERFGEEAMPKNLFMDELNTPSRVYFVALDDNTGEVIGYAGAWNTGDDYSIISVATTQSHARQGVASKLIGRLIGDAKEKSIFALSLEVNEHNEPAINLYRKLGFIITNTRKNYYKDRASAHIMWLYL